MSTHNLLRQLCWTSTVTVLAMLTACGGGGGDAPSASTDPASQATAASAPSVCGLQPAAQQGPETFYLVADQSMEVNGMDTQITLLTSPTGYSYAGVEVKMNLPLVDLREVALHGYPEGATADSMGVETDSHLAPGSVACVSGVSRVFDINGSKLVSWTSQNIPSLPVEQLTAAAVNGFEYTNNFDSTNAIAVFRMSKDALADPNTAAICHVVSSGSVDCATPDVRESADGLRWELRLPIVESGIYMLSSPPETQI